MTNPQRPLGRMLAAALGAALVAMTVAPRAGAQEFVGWIAAIEGAGEVLRAGATEWAPLAPADGLAQGDQVRTQAGARIKILLRDDSIVTVGESSQLRLDEQVAGPAPQSTFWLLFGRIRAIATERYGAAGAHFDVKTPTAIAGVRGTEFIAEHDRNQDETLVVGIVDTTIVRAATDATGERAVRLGPGEATRVRRGSYPTPATVMPAAQIRSLLNATGTRGGDLGRKRGSDSESRAEPRLPTRPGDRNGSPVERVVDTPFVGGRGPGRPAPPPPPAPGN